MCDCDVCMCESVFGVVRKFSSNLGATRTTLDCAEATSMEFVEPTIALAPEQG